MKEIKFRAWDNERNQMVYRDLDTFAKFGCPFIPMQEAVENNTIMQYTGFKDKNGKEVYEGDIIKAFFEEYGSLDEDSVFFPEKTIYGVVRINPHRTGMIIRKVKCEEEDVEPHFLEGKFVKIKTKYDEVIGNIYENPELLER